MHKIAVQGTRLGRLGRAIEGVNLIFRKPSGSGRVDTASGGRESSVSRARAVE